MNKCDLEETKHLALERFKELTADPNFLASPYSYSLANRMDGFKVGPFSVEIIGWHGGAYGCFLLKLLLSDVNIGSYSDPTFTHKSKPTTKVYKAALAKFEADRDEKRRNNHLWLAYQNVEQRLRKKREKETCERMAKALKDDCEKLQAALTGTTLREAMTPEFVEALEANERKWWRFWR